MNCSDAVWLFLYMGRRRFAIIAPFFLGEMVQEIDLQRGHLAQIEFCLQRVEMKFEKLTFGQWSEVPLSKEFICVIEKHALSQACDF